MPDDAQPPLVPGEEDPLLLDYASPRLVRRYQSGALWKSMVRVIGGVMVAIFLSDYISSLFTMPLDAWAATLAFAGIGALVCLIGWERGMVLKEPIWEGSKDLRAQSYRASASRFDSSGVMIVDPHSQRNDEQK